MDGGFSTIDGMGESPEDPGSSSIGKSFSIECALSAPERVL